MSKELCIAIFKQANVEINGTRSWDIRVSHDAFYAKVLRDGEVGLGESYLDGWWTCERLDLFIEKLIRANIEDRVKLSWGQQLKIALAIFQSARQLMNRPATTEVLNEIPKSILDPYLQNSCAYWRNGATDLNQAQVDKMELLCKKLNLKSGARLLDLGCGYGGFMRYAAEKYQVSGVGYDINKEQLSIGKEMVSNLPVSFEEVSPFDFLRQAEPGRLFDAISAIEILEYCSPKQYKNLVTNVFDCLTEDGVFLIHSVTSEKKATSWVKKNIFPHLEVPKLTEIISVVEELFNVEDIHNIGEDYAKTLMAWHENLQKTWDQLSVKDPVKYTLVLKRMYEYLFASCIAYFRTRVMHVHQVVMTKPRRSQPLVRHGGIQSIPIDNGDR